MKTRSNRIAAAFNVTTSYNILKKNAVSYISLKDYEYFLCVFFGFILGSVISKVKEKMEWNFFLVCPLENSFIYLFGVTGFIFSKRLHAEPLQETQLSEELSRNPFVNFCSC